MQFLASPGFLFSGSTGFLEWLLLLAVALIVFGPRRLPAIARRIGMELARWRQAADRLHEQLLHADADDDEPPRHDAYSKPPDS